MLASPDDFLDPESLRGRQERVGDVSDVSKIALPRRSGGGGDEEDIIVDGEFPSPAPQSNIADWEEQVSLLREEISLLRDDISGNTEKMAGVEDKITDMQQKMDEVKLDLDGEPLLPPDSFSLFVTHHSVSPGETRCQFRAHFLLPLAVILTQMVTLALVYSDRDGSVNYFGFPLDVTLPVRAAEYISVIIAVFTQVDLYQTFHLLNEGYDREAFQKSFGGNSSKCKWGVHIIFRFIEGAFGLFVTFILIMQQEEVVDLILNFTALEFVTKLDDIAFKLFEWGFFGSHMQKEAKKIVNAKYEKCDEGEKSRCHWILRPILLGIVFVTFIAAVAVINHKQRTGEYLRRKYPQCYVSYPGTIGDGHCDDWWVWGNTEECGWDGGDCL